MHLTRRSLGNEGSIRVGAAAAWAIGRGQVLCTAAWPWQVLAHDCRFKLTGRIELENPVTRHHCINFGQFRQTQHRMPTFGWLV